MAQFYYLAQCTMPFFIEDYFKKYKEYSDPQNYGGYLEYRGAYICTKTNEIKKQQFYHPYYIKIQSWVWNSNLPDDVKKEIDARMGTIPRREKYTEILKKDLHLQNMINGREPCYLKNMSTTYHGLDDFGRSFWIIFFAWIYQGGWSIVSMYFAINELIKACIHIFTQTSYDVKDDLVLACYHFCISVFYALHAFLAPLIGLVSFISRSVVTVNAWCNHHDEVSETSPEVIISVITP